MKPAIAMPANRRGQKLAFHLDEDDVTLAWEAARAAGLPRGAAVAAHSLFLPAWWWAGTGLQRDDQATLGIHAVPTTVGPAVVVCAGPPPSVDEEAHRIYAAAPQLAEAAWQKIRLAREGPDTEADYPLGAFVTPARHDAILVGRMALPAGRVVAATTVGLGAAPSEFARLQDAVGPYHSALVAFPDGTRTVGVWTAQAAPRPGDTARPVLRRLYRSQGAWRYGVKFGPGPAPGAPSATSPATQPF